MITNLLLNQFRPTIYCFATEKAKLKSPHYRSTIDKAFREASAILPFSVRLIFGRGIDKNFINTNIDNDSDQKDKEMLLETQLISLRCKFASPASNNSNNPVDMTFNEKIQTYHTIYDTILSSLYLRTRFMPYYFLPDLPVCLLIVVADNESLVIPPGLFPPWSIPTLKKTKKTTISLPSESEPPDDTFHTVLVNSLTKWLKLTFIQQYSVETTQVEQDYLREWTGISQAIVNFFNARDDPTNALLILKGYADLKAQQGNYKEAEKSYRKLCSNLHDSDHLELLSESFFLLACTQIIESRNPAFFLNPNIEDKKNDPGMEVLDELRQKNSINFNDVDLKETVGFLTNARKYALMLGNCDQAILCGLLEFEVRRVIKFSPYKSLSFILNISLNKDSIRLPGLNEPKTIQLTDKSTNQNQSDANNIELKRQLDSKNLFGNKAFSITLGTKAARLRATGFLRIVFPFLLEMISLYSRKRRRVFFSSLAAHAFLIRYRKIFSLNNGSLSFDNLDEIDDNFGGVLDPYISASLLMEASESMRGDNWPLVRQTVSLRALSININLLDLLVDVLGSDRIILQDSSLRIAHEYLETEMTHIALPCGFVSASVSDVYCRGFETFPPPSMRNNNDEWFALCERMFGSFVRGSFFNQNRTNKNINQINRTHCLCCVGEKVRIKINVKIHSAKFGLFDFSLLVSEYPYVDNKSATNIIKSSLDIPPCKFCAVDLFASPQVPGKYEVYGVKFEWNNLTHLECPFDLNQPIVIVVLPDYATPTISLNFISNRINEHHEIASDAQTPDNSPLSLNLNDANSNENLNATRSIYDRQHMKLVSGQIYPIRIKITNNSSYDYSHLSVLTFTRGPIECEIIEPKVTGILGLYPLTPLKKGESIIVTISVHPLLRREKKSNQGRAIHKVKTSQIVKGSNNISLTEYHSCNINNSSYFSTSNFGILSNDGLYVEASMLLLFPFWTSRAESSSQEKTFMPIPRFEYIEYAFNIIEKRRKCIENMNMHFTIDALQNSPAGIVAQSPLNTFAIGFSPFDNALIKNHTTFIDQRTISLNLTSNSSGDSEIQGPPPFCLPFVPNDKIGFWFSDGKSVYVRYVEDELIRKEKQQFRRQMRMKQAKGKPIPKKSRSAMLTSESIKKNPSSYPAETDNGLVNNIEYLINQEHKSIFAFMGGIEISTKVRNNEKGMIQSNINGDIQMNQQNLILTVKNVSGVDLNHPNIEIIQKKLDFSQFLLSGKLLQTKKLLKNNEEVVFDLKLISFSSNVNINVSFLSEEIQIVLPVSIPI